jgi:hypothetical protein
LHQRLERAKIRKTERRGDKAAAVLVKVLVAGRKEVVLVAQLDGLVDLGFGVVGRDQNLADRVLVSDGDDIWGYMSKKGG